MKKVEITEDILNKLVSLSSGAIALFVKCLYMKHIENKELKIDYLYRKSKVGLALFRQYIEELKQTQLYDYLGITGKLSVKPTGLKLGKTGELTDVKKTTEKIISKRKERAKQIKQRIMLPYFEVLRRKRLDDLLCDKVIKMFYAKISKVVTQYKDRLTMEDIYKILVSALDDPFLTKIGRATDVDFIFFKYRTLVERYLRNKNGVKKFKICDNAGNIIPEDEIGYFIKKNGSYIHIPPENQNALYYQIKKEAHNRLRGIRNPKFDKYFDDTGIIKTEYRYLLGQPGENCKFVKIV